MPLNPRTVSGPSGPLSYRIKYMIEIVASRMPHNASSHWLLIGACIVHLRVGALAVIIAPLLARDESAHGKSGCDQGVVLFDQIFRIGPGAIGALRPL